MVLPPALSPGFSTACFPFHVPGSYLTPLSPRCDLCHPPPPAEAQTEVNIPAASLGKMVCQLPELWLAAPLQTR